VLLSPFVNFQPELNLCGFCDQNAIPGIEHSSIFTDDGKNIWAQISNTRWRGSNMGAELWEFTAAFESETDTVETILAKHKTEIMALTPDWPDISVTDAPVPDFFTVALLPEDADLESNDTEFYDEIERGTGYFRIDYDGKKPKNVYFFGYSCD
jgi:hypothetical protein